MLVYKRRETQNVRSFSFLFSIRRGMGRKGDSLWKTAITGHCQTRSYTHKQINLIALYGILFVIQKVYTATKGNSDP